MESRVKEIVDKVWVKRNLNDIFFKNNAQKCMYDFLAEDTDIKTAARKYYPISIVYDYKYYLATIECLKSLK